ncbi:hypothetical_protein [Candidozyma auris]|uniref:hypothetical_protein n=1 Tax=Candidozyma auris TaxID=498019 RepID=UPI000D2CDC80|nr:hypothetical_protein [[Candida] auris]QEO21360.1 hypothetical_protein [[Candida] auris]
MSEPDNVRLRFDSSVYGTAEDPFLQDEDKIPIADLIPRILMERESFLNLTEEQLELEIAEKNNNSEPNEEEAVTADAQETSTSASQLFSKQKYELLSHINFAMNETSLSLDFVSLLMSAVKPTITKSTISPHLSKIAPLGSLNSDRLVQDADDQQQSDAKVSSRSKAESIGLGWKYQSLNHIKSLFESAGDSLRQQVDIERTYWNMINEVLSHDEVLFRVRDPLTGTRAIGVKYGYGDSGSSYFDQGLAVLRKDEQTGELSFSPIMTGNHKLSIKSNKFTRVKILSKFDDDYMLTGQSVFDKSALEDKSPHRIINEIEKARYFLFEDDLLYHLIREAKYLINYNVSIIANKIVIEIHDMVIEIESVIFDENNEEELENAYQNINKESSRNNEKAQAILIFLKLMLCCYYKYNLELKQKIPTSFTKWKQNNSHPLILRPLIGHIRHEINVRNMQTIIHKIYKKLDEQKFSYEIIEDKYSNLKKSEPVKNPFLKAVEKPLSKFKVILQKLSSKEHLLVEVDVTSGDIFVNLIVELTVSKYASKEDLEQNQQGANVLQLTFTDIFEVEESLNWTVHNFTQS